MNNSDTLLKAAINRLTVRLGEKIVDTASLMASLAQEVPMNLQKEWELLKEEIYEEAERLKQEEDNQNNPSYKDSEKESEFKSPIEKIDEVRSKVGALNKKIDRKK